MSSLDYIPSMGSLDLVVFETCSLASISGDIKSCQSRIGEIINKNKLPKQEEKERARSFIHTLRVFEVEVSCLQKDWEGLSLAVEVSRTSKRTCPWKHPIRCRRRFVPIRSL